MTVTGMDRRIRKLEGILPDGLVALTWDELEIHLLEVNRIIAANESFSAEKREEARNKTAELEAAIIRMVEEQATQQYQAHLEYCRNSWWKRTGRDDYVPALFYRNGFGEYDDWEKPNVMTRRAASRSSPIVQELLAGVPETTGLRTGMEAG